MVFSESEYLGGDRSGGSPIILSRDMVLVINLFCLLNTRLSHCDNLIRTNQNASKPCLLISYRAHGETVENQRTAGAIAAKVFTFSDIVAWVICWNHTAQVTDDNIPTTYISPLFWVNDLGTCNWIIISTIPSFLNDSLYIITRSILLLLLIK